MGTQQLLLIVLGVVIVGVAIAVGVTLFKSNAQDSNRSQVIGDLENLGSIAQQYYRKPLSFGGGGYNFKDFSLPPLDTGNGDGSYSIATDPPNDMDFHSGSVSPITNSEQVIYIIGCGKEPGNDPTHAVEAYMKVTPDSLEVTVVN